MSHTQQTTRPSTSADVYPRRFQTTQVAEPTILCVDDDPGISTAIQLHLRPYAVQVERAYCGMQGIWESVHQQPDLIIVDLAMPHGDGAYLLECLNSASRRPPFP